MRFMNAHRAAAGRARGKHSFGDLDSDPHGDSISSDQDNVGQTFRASLDGAVVVDGETVIPKRAEAFVKVVAIKAAGETSGKAEIKVQLESIVVGSKRYTMDSNVVLSRRGFTDSADRRVCRDWSRNWSGCWGDKRWPERRNHRCRCWCGIRSCD